MLDHANRELRRANEMNRTGFRGGSAGWPASTGAVSRPSRTAAPGRPALGARPGRSWNSPPFAASGSGSECVPPATEAGVDRVAEAQERHLRRVAVPASAAVHVASRAVLCGV